MAFDASFVDKTAELLTDNQYFDQNLFESKLKLAGLTKFEVDVLVGVFVYSEPFRQIGKRLGYNSMGGLHDAYKTALKKYKAYLEGK